MRACVVAFDATTFSTYLVDFSLIVTVFSPKLLGVPANRWRRYTLGVNTLRRRVYDGTSWQRVNEGNRARMVAALQDLFVKTFKRDVVVDCSLYLQASTCMVQSYLAEFAHAKGLVIDDHPTLHSFAVMGGAHFQRMVGYRSKLTHLMMLKIWHTFMLSSTWSRRPVSTRACPPCFQPC